MRTPANHPGERARSAEVRPLLTQCVPPPALVDGRMRCPRCADVLRFDGDEWDCLRCGYAYDAEAAAVRHRVRTSPAAVPQPLSHAAHGHRAA